MFGRRSGDGGQRRSHLAANIAEHRAVAAGAECGTAPFLRPAAPYGTAAYGRLRLRIREIRRMSSAVQATSSTGTRQTAGA
ncbi:MAG: hypothetical protein H6875_00160 [Hyphomicrobiaceae bacterium]|nr:hypothetical protein [Hyphomicrobiaceae bacterium]